jgi:hypothetical protein
MRLVGSDRNLKEVTINEGSVIPRQKDGTFHVEGAAARALVKSGDFAVAGTNFRHVRQGFICLDCGFNALIRDKCGKCNGTNLEEA